MMQLGRRWGARLPWLSPSQVTWGYTDTQVMATHYTALTCPALPCPALPCPTLPCPSLPCPSLHCPVPEDQGERPKVQGGDGGQLLPASPTGQQEAAGLLQPLQGVQEGSLPGTGVARRKYRRWPGGSTGGGQGEVEEIGQEKGQGVVQEVAKKEAQKVG